MELFGRLEELLRVRLSVSTIATAGVHQFLLSRVEHHLGLLFDMRAGRRCLDRNGVVHVQFGVHYLLLVLGHLDWSR